MRQLLKDVDPRRSLVASTIWLVIALAASFATAASLWVGNVAREIVVQQHVRRLVLETDQLASDVSQALTARLDALRAVTRLAGAADLYQELTAAYPDLGWFVMTDADGRVVAAADGGEVGRDARGEAWFRHAEGGPWLGLADADGAARLGDLAVPLRDGDGRFRGVLAAHLQWPAVSDDVLRISSAVDPAGSAQTLVLDRDGVVLSGPPALRGRSWTGAPVPELRSPGATRFERLAGGGTVLVARAALDSAAAQGLGWQVQLSEPREQVYQRADALAYRILWISIGLGVLTALVGAWGAQQLTERLKRLARSAAAVGRNEIAVIDVPAGEDEVALLAAGFAKVLDDLRLERQQLRALSSDLERRVAARTREVERLAEESRYAAVVRERLKIARDLHDTLAHSMMAMLSEIRLLRRLQAHDPAALPEELERAERVAHEGLKEARTAIVQMRLNVVRDTGLGTALGAAFDRFMDRTGIAGTFTADPQAASFGDERAETLFRMAEEALRNVERHAHATQVAVSLHCIDAAHLRLRINDNGVGFDPTRARPGHFGLVGLREQAQLIDAEIAIDSAPERGTIVTLTLRLSPELL